MQIPGCFDKGHKHPGILFLGAGAVLGPIPWMPKGQRVCSRALSNIQTWVFHLTTELGTISPASQKGKLGCWGRGRSPLVTHKLVAFIEYGSEAHTARLQACP